MQLLELSKAIEKNTVVFTRLNLQIFQWVYAGAGFDDYDERYGVLIHPKTGINAGIPLPNYIGDLNCALEATIRLLPQVDWSLYRKGKIFEATFWADEETEFSVLHENPASALLAAAFQAKHEMMREYGDENA